MSSKSNIIDTFMNYRSQLRKAIGGIVRSEDIDDIVQETFVKSYEAELNQEIQFERTYMLKTARNLALNHISRAAEKHNLSMQDCDELFMDEAEYSLETQVESKERFLNFCRATDTLSPEVKRVFLLKKVYGFSQREIAEYVGISESTVEKHVAKGLLLCSKYLNKLNQTAQKDIKHQSENDGPVKFRVAKRRL
ncbi:MAG: RNA polymerase sigma factor [Aestuariibacter sp.]